MDPAVGILIGAADAPSLAGNAAAASSSTTSCYHRGITVRSFACTCRVTAPGRRPDLASSACRRPRWRSPVRFSAVQPPVTEDHRWTSLRACRARKGSCAKPRARKRVLLGHTSVSQEDLQAFARTRTSRLRLFENDCWTFASAISAYALTDGNGQLRGDNTTVL